MFLNTFRDIINEIPKLARRFQIFCPLKIWVVVPGELRLRVPPWRAAVTLQLGGRGTRQSPYVPSCRHKGKREGSTSCWEENGAKRGGDTGPLDEEGRFTLPMCWELLLKVENGKA